METFKQFGDDYSWVTETAIGVQHGWYFKSTGGFYVYLEKDTKWLDEPSIKQGGNKYATNNN